MNLFKNIFERSFFSKAIFFQKKDPIYLKKNARIFF
jgi:hypothetical protein